MRTLGWVVSSIWIVFGAYWFASAFSAKASRNRTLASRLPAIITIALIVVLVRVFKGVDKVSTHSVALHVLGMVLLVGGLALAVWARLYIGRNWGMPMTQREEPELVTTGPYSLIRHPIYTGSLVALIGTALASDLYWLIVAGGVAVYFIWSALVEERNMTATFPEQYPAYRARTKMLIPFLF